MDTKRNLHAVFFLWSMQKSVPSWNETLYILNLVTSRLVVTSELENRKPRPHFSN